MQSKEQPGELRDALDNIPFQHPESARQQFGRLCERLSTSLAKTLPGLLADCPDPDSTLLLFDRLLSEGSLENLRLIELHPFLAHYAIAVFGKPVSRVNVGVAAFAFVDFQTPPWESGEALPRVAT